MIQYIYIYIYKNRILKQKFFFFFFTFNNGPYKVDLFPFLKRKQINKGASCMFSLLSKFTKADLSMALSFIHTYIHNIYKRDRELILILSRVASRFHLSCKEGQVQGMCTWCWLSEDQVSDYIKKNLRWSSEEVYSEWFSLRLCLCIMVIRHLKMLGYLAFTFFRVCMCVTIYKEREVQRSSDA